MTTNLVVADCERQSSTICLAVSPAMKNLGIRNRCRIYEIPPDIEYIQATPRMKLYIEYSADIYALYLKYISKNDIYVYSIDEAFIDITDYIPLYNMSAFEIAQMLMKDIYSSFSIPSSCGIGTNLYLAKIALDITAKHSKDSIGYLNESLYQKTLWEHKPLTDFWRIGKGIAGRLESLNIFTMKDIVNTDKNLLYKLIGIDAKFLIDHAYGREPVTIAEIKAYKPKANSISHSQVLFRDYTFDEAKLIIKEMVDLLCLELVERHMISDTISLYIGYSGTFRKPGKAMKHIPVNTNSTKHISKYFLDLFEKIALKDCAIRRIHISMENIVDEAYEQLDLFTDYHDIEKERKMQRAVNQIKAKYGKNSILRGMNLSSIGTTIERNKQIGGHKSGE